MFFDAVETECINILMLTLSCEILKLMCFYTSSGQVTNFSLPVLTPLEFSVQNLAIVQWRRLSVCNMCVDEEGMQCFILQEGVKL